MEAQPHVTCFPQCPTEYKKSHMRHIFRLQGIVVCCDSTRAEFQHLIRQLSTVFSSRLQSLESILPQRTRVSAMLRCAFWRPAAQSHGRIESFGTQECAALRLPACCQSSDHKTYYYLCATALSCCYIVSLHTYKSKHISYVYVFVCMHARKPQKREWS